MTLEGEYEPSAWDWVREQVEAYERSGGSEANTLWYHDIKADPTALMIQDGPEPFDAVAREVEGDERTAWWDRSVAVYPSYAEYQENTDRLIPVFVASRSEYRTA